MAPALGRALQQGAALPRQNVGGPDGVTGANQFDAHANPDGSTALLVPGQAALSWLCGDTRVKFDAGRWVPVWAGSTSAALATRVKLVPGQTVRVAVGNLIGPELAGLLALDLLGIDAVPVRIDGAGPSPRLAGLRQAGGRWRSASGRQARPAMWCGTRYSRSCQPRRR
jgi:hypothetical protein